MDHPSDGEVRERRRRHAEHDIARALLALREALNRAAALDTRPTVGRSFMLARTKVDEAELWAARGLDGR